ncbi:MAG: type IV pilus twitching motility protein PilT [Veillonella sp.]|nr:type IV pilus twitching motility protein PilT [Veillonella sp.]
MDSCCKRESLETIVENAIQLSSTDIHLQCGQPIYLRHGDGLKATSFMCTTELIEDILRRCGIASYEWQSLDEACSCCGVRMLLQKLCEAHDGLLLVCGPTGSGKSFTLACCIDYINQTMERHIITLEDPIEFEFVPKKSLIHQRQLGADINTMSDGIRDALREDPDVIMVGELRDRETLEAALHAAETGHLVMATMHTQRAVMAVHRMISLFPGEQQEEIRNQISQVLRAVICQRLLRWNKKFITIRDILLNTHAVANLIRTRKEPQIISIQETQLPMKTLEMAVRDVKAQYGAQQQLHTLLDQQLS